MLAKEVNRTLIFLWQDNNAIIDYITAYYLKNNTILRLQKRPSSTLINARIVCPVFGDLPFKWLYIPRAINDYNHYMNGVNQSNQLRKNFTTHRLYEHRVWHPLWYYILDVYAVNAYLVQRGDQTDKAKKGQRPFRNALINALLNTPYPQTEKPVKQRPRRSGALTRPAEA